METSELKEMSQADIETRVNAMVYRACQVFEVLEGSGRISGNGHHARQAVATYAVEELRKRWKVKE